MRLAAKLVSVLVVGVIVIVAIEAYVSISRDIEVFREEMLREARQLSHTLAELVEDVWQRNGRERAMELVEEANFQEPLVDVRVVWMDGTRGDPHSPRASAESLRKIQGGKRMSIAQRGAGGRGLLLTYAPLEVDPGRPVALEISRPLDAADKFRRDTIGRACLVAVSLTAISGVAVVVLGIVLIARPLNRLVEKTRRVGDGDLSGAVVLKGHDEMSELAQALNEMCEHLTEARERLLAETDARVQAIEQLRHADRVTTVGRLAAGTAHELGTPLNITAARADMICEETSQHSVVENARIVKAQVEKMTKIVRQLLDFARQRTPQKSKENLSDLAMQTAGVIAALAKKQNVEIRVETLGKPLVMEVDCGQIQQVLTNLMVNAIQAMQKSGAVRVRLRRTTARPPDPHNSTDVTCARIDVLDDGAGIPAEHLDQIFDPFFTTKDIGEGTGLGLAIAYGIVRDHGGWMEVSSRQGQGTTLSVFLPESN